MGSNKTHNKTQLRHDFVELATRIRDLSKYEFLQLLKNNDLEAAQNWINILQSTYDEFKNYVDANLTQYVVQAIIDGDFMGYVASFRDVSGSRMYRGSTVIKLTNNVDEAIVFSDTKQIDAKLYRRPEIIVYPDTRDNIGYIANPTKAGQKSPSLFSDNYYADIKFEFEPI